MNKLLPVGEAYVEKSTDQDLRGSLLQVCIGQNYGVVLAAKLQQYRFQVRGGFHRNLSTNPC